LLIRLISFCGEGEEGRKGGREGGKEEGERRRERVREGEGTREERT